MGNMRSSATRNEEAMKVEGKKDGNFLILGGHGAVQILVLRRTRGACSLINTMN